MQIVFEKLNLLDAEILDRGELKNILGGYGYGSGGGGGGGGTGGNGCFPTGYNCTPSVNPCCSGVCELDPSGSGITICK